MSLASRDALCHTSMTMTLASRDALCHPSMTTTDYVISVTWCIMSLLCPSLVPGPVQSYKHTHAHARTRTHARTHTHIHTRASYSSSRSYKQSSVLLLVPRPDQWIATNCCAYGLSLLYLAPCECAFIPISNSRSDSPAQLSSITLLNIRAFSLDHHVSHVVQF